MDENQTRPDVVHHGFEELLKQHNGGHTIRELDRRLQDLVLAIRDTKKAGTMTCKVTLSPAKGDVTRLIIDVEDGGKVPTPPRPSSLLFSTDAGVLQKRNPSQLYMDTIEEQMERKTTYE